MGRPRKPCSHGTTVGRCRDCRNERNREWRAAHPGRGTVAKKAWRVANPERQRDQAKKHRERGYWYKYGITYAEAVAMRAAQDNHCLGCNVVMGDKHGATRWNVDHFIDVAGNKVVRGILCTNCNKCIGLAGAGGHDPEALRRLAEYLEQRGYVKRITVAGTAPSQPQLALRLVTGGTS